jgi:hypothetical protein
MKILKVKNYFKVLIVDGKIMINDKPYLKEEEWTFVGCILRAQDKNH